MGGLFATGHPPVTNTNATSSAACFRRALVAAHVTMRATTMILFVALAALAFPQGTHAGCLTTTVEGFFEDGRLVDAIVGRAVHGDRRGLSDRDVEVTSRGERAGAEFVRDSASDLAADARSR